MEDNNLNVINLHKDDLENINGGVILTFCAIIGAVLALGEIAEAIGRSCR